MNTNARNGISRSEAIRRAREQVKIYRQGRGWVVDVWDEFCNAWRVGSERDYWQARQLAGQRMLEAAMREMGIEDDGVYNVSSQFVSDRGRCNN